MTSRILTHLSGLAVCAGLSIASAHATCIPASLSAVAANSNTKGDWVAWWCSPNDVYVAACIRAKCGLVGSKRAVAAWLRNPSTEALTFGPNPITDPALRAVWLPDAQMIIKTRPQ